MQKQWKHSILTTCLPSSQRGIIIWLGLKKTAKNTRIDLTTECRRPCTNSPVTPYSLWGRLLVNNKYLMTGPAGNSKFCFPGTLGKQQHWGREETKLTVSRLTSHQVFCYTSLLNSGKKLLRNRLFYTGWLISLLQFQGARPDHVRVESSCCCFPRELVSFVRPRESVSFYPRHVARFPPIRKRIWVGRYNNLVSLLTRLGV